MKVASFDGPPSREELLRRVRELRRELGEELPELASGNAGVSGRNVTSTVAAAERLGLARDALQERVSFSFAATGRPDVWITWAQFDELLESIEEMAGADSLAALGEQALESPLFRAATVVAGSFFSPHDLYTWMIPFVFREGGLYFRGVDARVEDHGPRHLRIVFESRGAVYSGAFAGAMAGIMRNAPRMLDKPRAEVRVERSPDRLRFDVTLARQDSVKSKLARWVRGDRGAATSEELRALCADLVEQNQRLEEQLEALEASRKARRRLEERLRQVRQMQLIGRFAGALAHDFNNLLTVVVSTATLLRTSPPHGPIHGEGLRIIEEAAQRAATLTRKLSKLGARHPGPVPPSDLRKVIDSLEPMIRNALGPGRSVAIHGGNLRVGVQLEPSAIEQILVNLAANARAAMSEGGRLTIEIEQVELGPEFVGDHPGSRVGRHVLLRVSDDGEGMTDAIRRRVFEPFFSTRSDDGGSGLGLASVHAVVTGAGGTVWVDSSPGEGATFRIYFPEVSLDDARSPVPDDGATEPRPGRVLFIDDDEMIRAALPRVLSASGYDVDVASNGDEALGRAKAQSYAIVVSDVLMPGLKGRNLADALRAELGSVPLLFISGYTDSLLDGELGPNTDFLAKPFTPHELLAKMAEMLG
jgi:signal transduction histidine kinase